jgi:hypothetical protein
MKNKLPVTEPSRIPQYLNSEDSGALLMQFVNERASQYVPVHRKGTPRGEPIGLSFQKYLAACLHLQNMPLRDIAKTARVSYGLLRKWRTESSFLKTIEHHALEFTIHELLPALRQREYVDELSNEEYDSVSEATSASNYSDVLCSAILEHAAKMADLRDPELALLRHFAMRQLISIRDKIHTRSERISWLRRVLMVAELLLEPPVPTEQDKKEMRKLTQIGVSILS